MDTKVRIPVSIAVIICSCCLFPGASSADQPKADADFQRQALERLGLKNSGLELTPEGLESGLTLPTPVRALVLGGLGIIGTEAQVPAIEKMLEEPSNRFLRPDIYRTLISISEKMPEERRISYQARLLKQVREGYRNPQQTSAKVLYAEMLLLLGDISGYGTIVDALNDPLLCGGALLKMSHLSSRDIRDASGKPLDWVTPVASVLKDRSRRESHRSQAAFILARLGEPGNAVLRDVLKDEPEGKIRFWIQAIFVSQEMHKDRIRDASPGSDSRSGE